MGFFDTLRGGTDGSRVAFVGIDGVPYGLVRDHPDVFENLHDLAEDGYGGAFDSIVPPESSACWPALTTGVDPGGTGVYGFLERVEGSYETYVPSGADVQATRLWDRATAAGRDATVINVPVTFPPKGTVQRMVSGFLSPSVSEAASDDDVLAVLEANDYRIDVDASLGMHEDKGPFLEDARATLEARGDVFEHYARVDDWDLFVGVFMAPDRVNHFLYGDYADGGEHRSGFLEFYRLLDERIGQLRAALADDVTLVVAADHGFTKLDHEVNVNQWLVETGWLEYGSDDHEELADVGAGTRAYSFGPGRIYLHTEGRHPRGTVAAGDRRAVRAELAADLEGLVGPDGRDVCQTVVEGESAFSGSHADMAPDLVCIPNDGYDLKASFAPKDAVFTEGPRNGMHTFENASLFTDADLTTAPSDLLDLAPTLLTSLDVDYSPGAFDGTSLVDG